jgi:hypothetical protein
MNICFVNNPKLIEQIPKEVSEKLVETIFICLNSEAKEETKETGMKAFCYDYFISHKDGDCLDNFILELRQQWYCHNGEDATTFENISLGEAYEYVIWWSVLIPAYKFLLAIDSVIKKELPRVIWWDISIDSFLKDVFDLVAKKHNISSVNLIGIDSYAYKKSWVWAPAKMSFKKMIVSRIFNSITRGLSILDSTRNKRRSVLLSYYQSMDNIVARFPHLNNFNFFFLAPAPIRKMSFKNSFVVYPQGIKRDLLNTNKIILKWRALVDKPDYLNKFSYNDTKVGHILKRQIDSVFIPQLPSLIQDVVFYKNILESQKIDFILLPGDTCSEQRIIAKLAKKYNIPSLIMLHGLPGIYTSIDNGFSDYFAVPADGIADTYRKTDRNKQQICITGDPKLDHYKKMRDNVSSENQPYRDILLLTNPDNHTSVLGSVDDAEEYIISLVTLLKEHKEINIIIKLHPSESLDYYHNVLKGVLPPNFSVIRDVPIETLLVKADLVVSAFSTVLLEAIALNKPIICVNFTKYPNPPPFDGNFGVKTYTDKNDLKNTFDDVFLRHNYLKNDYSRIIKEFTGPIDGQSSQRLLSLIERIIEVRQKGANI